MHFRRSWRGLLLIWVCAIVLSAPAAVWAQPPQATAPAVFARPNLMAWCIVPFDSKKRGPEARAEMLARMGIFQLAYDWRAEHIPTFDEEIQTLQRWGIKLSAFWFPGELNADAHAILDALKRNNVQTELWVSMNGGAIECTPEEQQKRVADHAAALRPVVEAAAAQGCKVGLYNHGAWFGEPENQIEILKALNAPNVGIVYNLHHGHGHLKRFPQLLEAMKPYLYCINLNGMIEGAGETDQKILPLGSGECDLQLLRSIRDSGYSGPIGILGHTMNDAEETLLDNLDGLDWLLPQLDGAPPAGPRPPLRVGAAQQPVGTPSLAPGFGRALRGSLLAEGNSAWRTAPFTVECRVRLHSRTAYNILVASDTKASGAHWEIFTEAGSGALCLYTPGFEPDHTRSDRDICDGNWHHVALQFAPDHTRVYLDGALVAEQEVAAKGLPAVDGGLAFGRLVEGGFFCDGELDDIRISRDLREIVVGDAPLQADDATLGMWHFDDLPLDPPVARAAALEDPARRAVLPEYQVIPAADPLTLSPAGGVPEGNRGTWARSHGDAHNTRFSALNQITRENVGQLKVAWEYHSRDRPGNVQCNPVVVDGVLYAPTSGDHVVALNAATGEEIWRFEPEGKPAFRGLLYWRGSDASGPRLFFPSGNYLYALDPRTGLPAAGFGEGGRIPCGEARVAPAVYQQTLILPLYLRDVAAFDALSGAPLWVFHTIPQGDEYGADTWEAPEEGANCWGGMALDEGRGIAYVSLGSPKPNFSGNLHHGQNLFANCVLALNALTGERLWHFQELRHDIWDLDIPAAPNLVSITFEGRKVDAVAQVTKLGNTLLLDRVTGKPLFPFRLRRAPVSRLAGERTWPYQPDPVLPEPFARQEFTLDDVTDRSPQHHADVLRRIEHTNFGWFETFEEDKPTVLYGFHGGAEWTGAAFDPGTGRLYVTANRVPWIVTVFRRDTVLRDPNSPPTRGEAVYESHCVKCHGPERLGVGMAPPLHGLGRRLSDEDVRAIITSGRNSMPALPQGLAEEEMQALLDFLFLRDVPQSSPPAEGANAPLRYTHNGYPKLLDFDGYPACKPPWGTLNCLDLASGKLLWQKPLGTYPELAMWGEDNIGAENFGGPSLTAGGLIFCAGTPDEMIRAFDAGTGEVLWEHPLPFGGYAPPTIYEADGREFVVIAATGGGKLGTTIGDAYVAFAL